MRKSPLAFWIGSVIVFTFALLFIARAGVDFGGRLTLWLVYTFMSAVAEIFPVTLPQIGSVSVGFAVNYATLLSFGPGASALSAGLAMLAGDFDRPIRIKMMNFGQIALAAGCSSASFHSFWPELSGIVIIQQILPAGLAALLYASINITLVTAAGALQTGTNYWELLVNNFKWSIPNYLSLFLLGLLLGYIVLFLGYVGFLLFIVPLFGSRYIFQAFKRINRTYEVLYQSIYSIHEMRDSFTRGHAERVAFYARNLAKELGMNNDEVERMALAGMLHDIGKVAISDEILNKPDRLTEYEKGLMERHVIFGANLVGKFSFYPLEMTNIVRYHHEWFNGAGGYPGEVSGDKIPFASRVLAVCDAFDAMTTTRPYRTPISPVQAIEELIKGKGIQFDPKMVDSFIVMLKNKGIISNATEEVQEINGERKCC